MAEVKMDLNELKALEAKLEKLEIEKQTLIDQQKMVLVLHKYFTGRMKPGKSKGSVRVTGIRELYNMDADSWRYGGMCTNEAFDDVLSISNAINAGYIDVDIKEDDTRISREFINLSEAEELLRQSLNVEYDQRSAEIKERANKAEYELSTIDDKHLKRLRSLTESYQNDVVKLKKEHDAEMKTQENLYTELTTQYNDLKEDKQRISLEKQVGDLSVIIYDLQHRGFWQRLFNL